MREGVQEISEGLIREDGKVLYPISDGIPLLVPEEGISLIAAPFLSLCAPNLCCFFPMTEIETLRHSCAHVLATAILRIWPEAQFAAGPPVDNGFYYDLEAPHRITPEDFAQLRRR